MGIFDSLRKKKCSKRMERKDRGQSLGDVYIRQKNEALIELLGAQMTWNHGHDR